MSSTTSLIYRAVQNFIRTVGHQLFPRLIVKTISWPFHKPHAQSTLLAPVFVCHSQSQRINRPFDCVTAFNVNSCSPSASIRLELSKIPSINSQVSPRYQNAQFRFWQSVPVPLTYVKGGALGFGYRLRHFSRSSITSSQPSPALPTKGLDHHFHHCHCGSRG